MDEIQQTDDNYNQPMNENSKNIQCIFAHNSNRFQFDFKNTNNIMQAKLNYEEVAKSQILRSKIPLLKSLQKNIHHQIFFFKILF